MSIIRKDLLEKKDHLMQLLTKADTINAVKFYQGGIATLDWVLNNGKKPDDGFNP